jgi:hypothetical protein
MGRVAVSPVAVAAPAGAIAWWPPSGQAAGIRETIRGRDASSAKEDPHETMQCRGRID